VHGVFLLYWKHEKVWLHPEYSAKFVIEFVGALALRATGKEFAWLRLHVPAEHELVLAATTKWTGFPIQVSTNGPNLSNLFVHRSLLQEMMPMSHAIECDIGVMTDL
jgi:hypothetical protein